MGNLAAKEKETFGGFEEGEGANCPEPGVGIRVKYEKKQGEPERMNPEDRERLIAHKPSQLVELDRLKRVVAAESAVIEKALAKMKEADLKQKLVLSLDEKKG